MQSHVANTESVRALHHHDPGGFIITDLLGIAGMFPGAWLAGLLGIRIAGGLGEFVVGVVGAIIVCSSTA